MPGSLYSRLDDTMLGHVVQQIPEVQVPGSGSVVQVSSVDFMDCIPTLQGDSTAFINEMPKLPAGTVIVPQDSQVMPIPITFVLNSLLIRILINLDIYRSYPKYLPTISFCSQAAFSRMTINI